MKRTASVVSVCLVTALSLTSVFAHAAAPAFVDSPVLATKVAQGKLPAVTQRLPRPARVVTVENPGRHGGDLRMLMARVKDVRMMVVYGYARLVGYDEKFEIQPDILERIEVEGQRVFTLHLREGHKWSDGHPFTAEDFRYWWEDIANNRELSPFGASKTLLVDGEPPTFEVVDATTVRYSWKGPNPFFLPALAGSRALYIYSPAHYLKQFHIRYADPKALAEKVRAAGVRDWSAVHARMDAPYQNDNPDFPTLQPWVNTTQGPSDRYVFMRNPYFHRVDQHGRQLPYIDRVIVHIADGSLIAAKTGAGESDLQARYLKFSDYTFLKKSEKRTNTKVKLWATTKGSHIALYPNLNVSDPGWRKLVRDVRFRRALSLAVNRHEINQVLYYGLATEGNNSVNISCPLYRPEYRTAWAEFDLTIANKLLDELGLTSRDRRGVRLLPDGRPMVIIVETAGESTEQTDVLELIHDTWLKAGIKLFSKPIQREVFRNRVFSGKTLMSVWSGLDNALVTADMSPQQLAPVSQQQLQWPKWGQYYETGGSAGEPIDVPAVQELARLNGDWANAASFKARERIWQRMLEIHADQIFTIGLVSGVPQPVVISQHLRNVPNEGVYNWEPGAYFGVYKPDTFWFANTAATGKLARVDAHSGK
ncbi:MAG: ABC transporter substrate-binding protein [Acidiferrobacterales bacterium]